MSRPCIPSHSFLAVLVILLMFARAESPILRANQIPCALEKYTVSSLRRCLKFWSSLLAAPHLSSPPRRVSPFRSCRSVRPGFCSFAMSNSAVLGVVIRPCHASIDMITQVSIWSLFPACFATTLSTVCFDLLCPELMAKLLGRAGSLSHGKETPSPTTHFAVASGSSHAYFRRLVQ